jgi:hypothetical protein
MTTPTHHIESSLGHGVAAAAPPPVYEQWSLDDDRIMIDIETEMATRSPMQSNTENSTGWIPHFLLEGRTLGPLFVLIILVLYSLLSPMLSPAFHEYVYHILH